MMLTDEHIARKREAYWDNLVGGDTGRYKAAVIELLLERTPPAQCRAVLDIGCGTSVIALHHRHRLSAERMVCMDYDPNVVAAMKAQSTATDIDWWVADIFAIDEREDRFDLVFLLDMLHEVYSFKGRTGGADSPVDHERGMNALTEALKRVGRIVNPGGAIIITDNVLSEENAAVTVRPRTPAALAAVRRFFAEYPSRLMAPVWGEDGRFTLPARDLCILLTQYNKIKAGQEDRWAIERLEIHQYMSVGEARRFFDGIGFDLDAVVGTPEAAMVEWDADFEVLDGLPALPEKRITLVARKRLPSAL